MSHQNLKKISGIHIDHTQNKIWKNEGFLKVSLFNAAWFLQKMALKPIFLILNLHSSHKESICCCLFCSEQEYVWIEIFKPMFNKCRHNIFKVNLNEYQD